MPIIFLLSINYSKKKRWKAVDEVENAPVYHECRISADVRMDWRDVSGIILESSGHREMSIENIT